MRALKQHQGVVAPMDRSNVDTDMIIPKQFLKTIERSGLGKGLFHELRFDADGAPIDSFPLNQPQYQGAEVLVAGDNFGCGSSREHAPWALLDWGFRCVIAPSFADIFYGNCFNNGILPIALPQAQVDQLMTDAQQASRLQINLAEQSIQRANGEVIHFDIAPEYKIRLLEGLDLIGMTLQQENSIAAYEDALTARRDWVLRGTKAA